jgi:hypothetical protein
VYTVRPGVHGTYCRNYVTPRRTVACIVIAQIPWYARSLRVDVRSLFSHRLLFSSSCVFPRMGWETRCEVATVVRDKRPQAQRILLETSQGAFDTCIGLVASSPCSRKIKGRWDRWKSRGSWKLRSQTSETWTDLCISVSSEQYRDKRNILTCWLAFPRL